jgi:hypothetical protein
MVGRTKRGLLVDPASSEPFQIHTIPGISLFWIKVGTENHGSVAEKSEYSESGEFFYHSLFIFHSHSGGRR